MSVEVVWCQWYTSPWVREKEHSRFGKRGVVRPGRRYDGRGDRLVKVTVVERQKDPTSRVSVYFKKDSNGYVTMSERGEPDPFFVSTTHDVGVVGID